MLSLMLVFNIMIISYSLLNPTSPLLTILILLLMSVSISVLLNMILSAWLMISMVLIFLGGMMIIFIYVTTLASTDKIVFPKYMFIMSLFFTCLFYKESWFLLSSPTNLPLLFESISGELLLFLTGYLILSLFLVVKTSSWESGALSYK